MTEFNKHTDNCPGGLLAQRLAAIRAGERGSTLMEMMITISIMSIIGLGMVYLMTALFNTFIEGNQRYLQQTEQSTVVDFLQSKTAGLKPENVGLENPNGSIDPLSFAGDQIVFVNGGVCYRIFYLGNRQQLRVATSSQGCEAIRPERGPNETVEGGGYVQTDPEAEDRDPVLDNLEIKSFVLATDATLDAGPVNAPLRYYSADSNSQYDNDAGATRGSTNPFYAEAGAVKSTGEIQVDFWLGTPIPSGRPIPPKPLQLSLYLDS